MTPDQMILAMQQRIREADAEAEASRVAFASGNFIAYMRAKVQRIKDRVEAEYDQLEDHPKEEPDASTVAIRRVGRTSG